MNVDTDRRTNTVLVARSAATGWSTSGEAYAGDIGIWNLRIVNVEFELIPIPQFYYNDPLINPPSTCRAAPVTTGRRVRQQKRAHAAEIVRRAVAPERNRAGAALLPLRKRDARRLRVDFVKVRQSIGGDPARQQRVHADLIGRELEREGLDERRHAGAHHV